MEKKIDLNGKLDYSSIDLTAPDLVITEIMSQLPEQTNGIVYGSVSAYSGPIESYTKQVALSAFADALGRKEVEVDIQKDLGATGEKRNKFECFLVRNNPAVNIVHIFQTHICHAGACFRHFFPPWLMKWPCVCA